MLKVVLTKEEKKAIASLKRLAKKWPSSISLFSWAGGLHVFKHCEDKEVDIDYIDGIPNDGGDPNSGEQVWYDSDVEIEYEE